MKNPKRILAVIGVILLVGLYLATLIFALIGSPRAMEFFKISVGLTILVPVLLWIYLSMFQYMDQRKKLNQETSGEENLQ